MNIVNFIAVAALLVGPVNCQNGVGFTAHADGEIALDGSTLIFPTEIENIGTLYSTTTGEFTCPSVINGFYHFQLTIKSASLAVAEARIVKVSGGTETTISTVRTGDGFDMASNGVTIQCGVTGDIVKVVGVSGTIYGDAGRGQNTFTGFGHRLLD